MADNLKYNEPGSGPLVATDDVGSTHYQIVKLDLGAPDGSSSPIDGKIPVTIVSGTGLILAASTANIGDVDIASPLGGGTEGAAVRVTIANNSTGLVSIDDDGGSLTVDQGTGSTAAANAWLVSGTLNIGDVQTNITIKFVRINATSDGDNTIISGVTNKKIRVLGYALTVTTAATITIQDTAGSPNIFAQFSLAAQGGVSYSGGIMCPAFETLAGNGVEINVNTGQDCLGHMTYQEV
jgi:hypothetical protein